MRQKKDKRTELQKAADRVAEMEAVVAQTEKDLKVCEDAYNKAALAFEEARRNHYDTALLLKARQDKLMNERSSATRLLYGTTAVPNWNSSKQAHHSECL